MNVKTAVQASNAALAWACVSLALMIAGFIAPPALAGLLSAAGWLTACAAVYWIGYRRAARDRGER